MYGKRLHISDCRHFCPRSDKAAKSRRKVEKINKHKIELDYTHRKVSHFVRKPSKISPHGGMAGRSAKHYFDNAMMARGKTPTLATTGSRSSALRTPRRASVLVYNRNKSQFYFDFMLKFNTLNLLCNVVTLSCLFFPQI